MALEEFLLVDDREVVITDAMQVRCDGGKGALGHPGQYLTLEEGEVTCKYCGRRYVHVSSDAIPRIRAVSRPYAA